MAESRLTGLQQQRLFAAGLTLRVSADDSDQQQEVWRSEDPSVEARFLWEADVATVRCVVRRWEAGVPVPQTRETAAVDAEWLDANLPSLGHVSGIRFRNTTRSTATGNAPGAEYSRAKVCVCSCCEGLPACGV